MEGILNLFFKGNLRAAEKGREETESQKREDILEQIKDVKIRLCAVKSCYDLETDFDMISCYISEMEALEKRYDYLLKRRSRKESKPLIWLNKKRSDGILELKDIMCTGIFVLLFIINRLYYTKSKYGFFKRTLAYTVSVGFLALSCFALKSFGIPLSMNVFSICLSLLLGIPGVILIILAAAL